MNKRTGNLLIIGGFGIMTATSAITTLGFAFRLAIPNVFAALLGFAGLLSWLLVVLGFGVLFLAERSLIDLIIAIGLTLGTVAKLLSGGIIPGQDIIGLTNGTVAIGKITHSVSFICTVLISLALILWAVRLFKSTPLGALLVITSLVLPFIFPRIIFAIFGTSAFAITLGLLAETATTAFRAIAAYLDM